MIIDGKLENSSGGQSEENEQGRTSKFSNLGSSKDSIETVLQSTECNQNGRNDPDAKPKQVLNCIPPAYERYACLALEVIK